MKRLNKHPESCGKGMKTLSDEIQPVYDEQKRLNFEYLFKDKVKQTMDKIKEEIKEKQKIVSKKSNEAWAMGVLNGFKEAIEIIDKHLGDKLK